MSALAGIDIGAAFEGIRGIVDEFKVTDEERAKVDVALLAAHNDRERQVLEYSARIAEAQRDAVVADAQSQSKLAQAARPLTLLSFVGLVIHQFLIHPYLAHWFAMPRFDLPEQIWTVISVSIGGYIAARSAEKLVGSAGLRSMMGETSGARREQRKTQKMRLRQRRKLAKAGLRDQEIEDLMGEGS